MKRSLVFLCLQVGLVASALAGTQPNAKVALHTVVLNCDLNPGGVCAECTPVEQGLPCSNFHSQAWLYQTNVYLVVAQADPVAGIAGISLGVEYDMPNVAVFGFTLCGDLDFPNGGWPLSGGGNRITWNYLENCQRTEVGSDGAHAVAGCIYAYAYGAGELRITPNKNLQSGPELTVADCAIRETDLPFSHAGSVMFSDTEVPGCNPCLGPCGTPIPVERATWGRIKTRFGK